MHRCKICLSSEPFGLKDLLFNSPVCGKCLNHFKDKVKTEIIDGIEYVFLYDYDHFFREIIYLYKAKYNKSLAVVFTYKHSSMLKRKYKGYTFLCVPSNERDNEKRGYNHVEEIAYTISSKVVSPFIKVREWKQSNKKREEREKIKDYITLNDVSVKKLKKVVIIDDIYSTGNTIKACIRHLNIKSDIKVLCICRNVSKKV